MTNPIRRAVLTSGMLVVAAAAAGQSSPIAGLTCSAPPRIDCPAANCKVDQVRAEGNAVEPKTGRRFFLDYPCDLKSNEELVFVLSLHGAGSIGNWQRHYFPIVDLKDKYRLIIATPTAATSEPTRRWVAEADDAYLQNLVDFVYQKFGANRIRSFWLAPTARTARPWPWANSKQGWVSRSCSISLKTPNCRSRTLQS